MVLVDAHQPNDPQPSGPMREFLYRDRTKLAVYSLAMFGLALHKQGDQPQQARDALMRNIKPVRRQQDDENQTA